MNDTISTASSGTIGILGAGQLGRMLALAGVPLGLQFRFLDPASNAPAARLGEQMIASYDDPAVVQQFIVGLDLVTYEFENVPTATAAMIAEHVPVFPPPVALATAQDRLIEKRFFQSLGIPTAPFLAVDTRADLDEAIAALGFPAVLKTRRLGYDGKGQAVIHGPDDLQQGWAALGGQPLILEGFVPFTRELSLLAVRDRQGATACYPLVENLHREGILRRSIAPAPQLPAQRQLLAESYAIAALNALEYVGVLAIELFESNQALIVNEMAPRVHNSGHWTIEGSETSQFENHVRAVAGLPLGSTAMRGYAAMVNLIGVAPATQAILAIPGAHLHLYEKAPRPGRKLGHITVCADDMPTLLARIAKVELLL